jgi:hypothetical protein
MTLSSDDRLAIVDLVTRADAAATVRDVEGYLSCFTDDADLGGAKGDHHGKDGLRRSVGSIWAAEGDTTAHLCLNVVIDETGDRQAVVRSILLIVGAADPRTLVDLVAITQDVVKTGPDWKVSRRDVRNLIAATDQPPPQSTREIT